MARRSHRLFSPASLTVAAIAALWLFAVAPNASNGAEAGVEKEADASTSAVEAELVFAAQVEAEIREFEAPDVVVSPES